MAATPPASLVGSREWLEAAFETVNREASPYLVAVEADGRIVGLLTLAIDDRAGQPALRLAGSPFNDLADLLALPGYEEAAATTAVSALKAAVGDGLSIDLNELDPAGALVAGDPNQRQLVWQAHTVAPTIDLVDPLAEPSRRQRHRWRQTLQRLCSRSMVEFRWREGSVAVNALEEFNRLRSTRLQTLGRDFHNPPLPFLEATVARLAPLGRCAFMEMTVDGVLVARDLYLLDGTVAMLWLRGLDMEWLHHTCGHLLLRESTIQLREAGFTTLDLGRGDEQYKFAFGAHRRVLLSARLPALASCARGVWENDRPP